MKIDTSKDLHIQYQNEELIAIGDLQGPERLTKIEERIVELERIQFEVASKQFEIKAKARVLFEERDKIKGRKGIFDPEFKKTRDNLITEPDIKVNFGGDVKKFKIVRKGESKDDKLKAALGGFSLAELKAQVAENKKAKSEEKLPVEKTELTQEAKDKIKASFMAKFKKS